MKSKSKSKSINQTNVKLLLIKEESSSESTLTFLKLKLVTKKRRPGSSWSWAGLFCGKRKGYTFLFFGFIVFCFLLIFTFFLPFLFLSGNFCASLELVARGCRQRGTIEFHSSDVIRSTFAVTTPLLLVLRRTVFLSLFKTKQGIRLTKWRRSFYFYSWKNSNNRKGKELYVLQ